jgi:hypothetical protein
VNINVNARGRYPVMTMIILRAVMTILVIITMLNTSGKKKGKY